MLILEVSEKNFKKIFRKGNQSFRPRVLGGWYTHTPLHYHYNTLTYQHTNTQISKILSLFFVISEKKRTFVYGTYEDERSRSRSRCGLQRFSLPVPNSSLTILKDGSCVGYVARSLHYTGIYAANAICDVI